MDYSKIVSEGYCDENSREFLEQYFLREFKKAEKEHFFGASEFFSGCRKVTKVWENFLKQREAQMNLDGSYTFTMPISSLKTGLPYQIGLNEINQINLAIVKAFLKTQSNKEQPAPSETLASIITHTNSNEIVEAIKIQYKNIKGKGLKLLLLALQELDLLPKERIASKFHRLCKIEFDWEIASYNAMNGYNYNEITDVEDFEAMVSFLKELINNK
ncbi:MAG: hypothetical protein PHI03_04590 [Bacteroidales bacterium]|nr:hypothetical protein [Bacteroidales bacterium]